MSQLDQLAERIPDRYIGHNDRDMPAADHTVISQRLLQVVGPYSLEVVEVLRSQAPPITTRKGDEHPGGMYVTGVVARLTVTIDGRTVSVEEAGGCEQAALKDGDGERLKHAMSDAIKRSAMRLGLGLHIWAQDNYFLDQDRAAPERSAEHTAALADLDAAIAEWHVDEDWAAKLRKFAAVSVEHAVNAAAKVRAAASDEGVSDDVPPF